MPIMEIFTPRLLEEAAHAFADRLATGKLVGAFVAGSGISLAAPDGSGGCALLIDQSASVVAKSEINTLIPALIEQGATGIIELPISKIVN